MVTLRTPAARPQALTPAGLGYEPVPAGMTDAEYDRRFAAGMARIRAGIDHLYRQRQAERAADRLGLPAPKATKLPGFDAVFGDMTDDELRADRGVRFNAVSTLDARKKLTDGQKLQRAMLRQAEAEIARRAGGPTKSGTAGKSIGRAGLLPMKAGFGKHCRTRETVLAG